MMRKVESKHGAKFLKGSLIAGALFSMTALSAAPTSGLFDYNVMGSGAEVRTELLDNESSPKTNLELNCGEKEAPKEKAKEAKKEATKEAKSKEAKCGEGKCGEEGKKAKKSEKKAEKKAKESKSKEAKCGEGKCGD